MVRYGAAILLLVLLVAGRAEAQNSIAHDGWEGFATRDPQGAFDRCVLYNRSIAAISVTPYDMLGISRDRAGRVGLLVFYNPRTLVRETHVPVTLKIDDNAPITASGRVVSDFHISIDGPLEPPLLAQLRAAKRVTATAEGHSIGFDVSDVAGVLQALTACVQANAH